MFRFSILTQIADQCARQKCYLECWSVSLLIKIIDTGASLFDNLAGTQAYILIQQQKVLKLHFIALIWIPLSLCVFVCP